MFLSPSAICFSWRPPRTSATATSGSRSLIGHGAAPSPASRESPAAFPCCCAPCWPASCSTVSRRIPRSRPWIWVPNWFWLLFAFCHQCEHPQFVWEVKNMRLFPFFFFWGYSSSRSFRVHLAAIHGRSAELPHHVPSEYPHCQYLQEHSSLGVVLRQEQRGQERWQTWGDFVFTVRCWSKGLFGNCCRGK